MRRGALITVSIIIVIVVSLEAALLGLDVMERLMLFNICLAVFLGIIAAKVDSQ